ncbi:DoxX family membrane protein [Chitinophaga sp. G-6-1-13]|uniref:DoxX family membrane protein n=1 Tax=Chitinophaga fulva TaxID=2728842 RepID=A0A848GL62_9BACT|nr:DoxX family membrane protein [Chitinophaga fulva]NML39096.1 DoxX family membrane protein [Chitinophaga fulva]
MKFTEEKITAWFLRIALSAGFLSAVADRFGLWGAAHSAWGNWDKFLQYTATLLPGFPAPLVSVAAVVATAFELIFGIALLFNFRTRLVAQGSGILLILFALAMAFSRSIKAPLDFSVFSAAAAAFALAGLKKQKG